MGCAEEYVVERLRHLENIAALFLAPPLYGIIKALIRLEIKCFIFADNFIDKLIKKERDEE